MNWRFRFTNRKPRFLWPHFIQTSGFWCGEQIFWSVEQSHGFTEPKFSSNSWGGHFVRPRAQSSKPKAPTPTELFGLCSRPFILRESSLFTQAFDIAVIRAEKSMPLKSSDTYSTNLTTEPFENLIGTFYHEFYSRYCHLLKIITNFSMPLTPDSAVKLYNIQPNDILISYKYLTCDIQKWQSIPFQTNLKWYSKKGIYSKCKTNQ